MGAPASTSSATVTTAIPATPTAPVTAATTATVTSTTLIPLTDADRAAVLNMLTHAKTLTTVPEMLKWLQAAIDLLS